MCFKHTCVLNETFQDRACILPVKCLKTRRYVQRIFCLIRNERYRVPTSFFLRFIPFIFNSENTSCRLFQINITDTQIKFRQTFRLKLKALRDTYSSGTCYIIQLLSERLTSKCVQHILVLPTEMSLNIEKIVLENI